MLLSLFVALALTAPPGYHCTWTGGCDYEASPPYCWDTIVCVDTRVFGDGFD